MANDSKALVGGAPWCSRCKHYHTSNTPCIQLADAWWNTGAWKPDSGGRSSDPQPDIDLAVELTTRWTNQVMIVQEFVRRSSFRMYNPECAKIEPVDRTSDHSAHCDSCLWYSVQYLLRWKEERDDAHRIRDAGGEEKKPDADGPGLLSH